MQYFKVFII